MKFKVTRRHLGDKMYEAGDIREGNEADLRPLIESGVLVRADEKPAIETKPMPKAETKRGRK